MRRRHFGSTMWFGALCGAVALTRLDQAAERARVAPFPGCLARRLAKLLLWALPVTAGTYSLVIYAIIRVFAFVPAAALALGLIFFAAGVMQAVRMTKSAVFGEKL